MSFVHLYLAFHLSAFLPSLSSSLIFPFRCLYVTLWFSPHSHFSISLPHTRIHSHTYSLHLFFDIVLTFSFSTFDFSRFSLFCRKAVRQKYLSIMSLCLLLCMFSSYMSLKSVVLNLNFRVQPQVFSTWKYYLIVFAQKTLGGCIVQRKK